MRFEAQIRLPVSAADAWDLLWDARRLAACLPGCVEVVELEVGKSYRARFEDHGGLTRIGFDLDAMVQDAQPERRIQLLVTGPLGGSQSLTLQVEFRQANPTETILDVRAELEARGKIESLGQSGIRREAGDLVNRFAQSVEAELRSLSGGHRYA